MRSAVQWWDRRQVPLYIGAILLGAVVGLLAPGSAAVTEALITPVLALLLFATFLAVPTAQIGRAFRDVRFLGILVALNFFVVPLVVYGLSRLVAHDEALLLGVLLVLLCPCVDYVIVFSGLAGGASDRLLAAVPVLMVAQIVLLPVYLWLFAGSATLAIVELGPFAWAAFTLIVIPLAAATVVQRLAQGNPAGRSTGVECAGSAIESGMAALMVPLMMATLAVVVASQVEAVGRRLADLVTVISLFVVFAAVMLFVGLLVGRLARLPQPETTAVAFSGVTRNSLVVLPLALALPSNLALAPLVVVTQTLVELVMMVVLVRVLPPIARRFAHPVAVAK